MATFGTTARRRYRGRGNGAGALATAKASAVGGNKPAGQRRDQVRVGDDGDRECFLALHQAAARGDLANWPETPDGALGLVLLLDQYPRNAFRDTPRMYEPDPMALAIASAAVGAGHDRALDDTMAMFLYLPFGHAENGVDQEMSVSLVRRLGPDVLSNAERHGKHHPLLRARFPHRNAILGWNTTRCERRFLPQGGFTG